jgi:hypothetical protein
MAASTRRLVEGVTDSPPLATLETVCGETAAARATSRMDTGRWRGMGFDLRVQGGIGFATIIAPAGAIALWR